MKSPSLWTSHYAEEVKLKAKIILIQLLAHHQKRKEKRLENGFLL